MQDKQKTQYTIGRQLLKKPPVTISRIYLVQNVWTFGPLLYLSVKRIALRRNYLVSVQNSTGVKNYIALVLRSPCF